MRFTNTITVRRQRADVFAFLATFENVPRWNYAIERTSKVSSGPVGVGSTYVQHRTVPAPADETFEVTEYEPDRRLSIRGTLGRFPAQVTYLLDSVDDATRLTNAVELEPGGALALVAPLATPRIKAAVAENLQVLKHELEEPNATPNADA